MGPSSQVRRVAERLIQVSVWACACSLPVAAQFSPCTNPTQVPNETITAGARTYRDNNALQAAAVTIGGSADVSFLAGNCIHLAPGFRATAGTAPTTFHAWVDATPTIVSVSPVNGSGLNQQFTFVVSSPAGSSDIRDLWVLFNTSVTGTNSCYFGYIRQSNMLSVADANAVTGWSPGIVPGSSSTTGNFNTNCTLNGSGSSVSASGNQLTLTASITFQPSFSGGKNVYLDVYSNGGLHTGWQQVATSTASAPPVTQYYLTTAANPTGAGTIFPPSGWHNGGTQVSVSASAASGYYFTGFSGSIGGASPQTITMDSNKSVTANFSPVSPQQYYLTTAVNPPGAGTISPASGSYNSGALVTVIATPFAGYQFTGFSGALTGGSPGYIAMDSNKSVTANFALATVPTHTITSVPAGLTLTIDETTCTTPCVREWNAGTSHTLSATNISGWGTRYVFTNWSDGGTASHMIAVPSSPMTYTAYFNTQYYLTTAAAPATGGTISPASGWHNRGEQVTIAATSNTGYPFSGFSGGLSGQVNPQILMMNGPVSVAANFSQSTPPHTISGQVTTGDGSPLFGVALSLSGTQSASAITGADGKYAFTVSPGSYVVTPSMQDYGFYPGPWTNANVASDQAGIDFAAGLLGAAMAPNVAESASCTTGTPTLLIWSDLSMVST